MPSKNKKRGNDAERAFVELAKEHGLKARRAWGSDGRSMGEHEAVDIRIDFPDGYNVLLQVKRRKAVADYLLPDPFVHAQCIYMDGKGSRPGRKLVVLDAESYFKMLSGLFEAEMRME